MTHGVVVPVFDLDMASEAMSPAIADVQRGLQLVRDNTASFTGDGDTDTLLKPFMGMFQFERIKTPYHLGHVLLLLYSPFGVVLMLLRILCSFTLAFFLPKLLSEAQMDNGSMHKLFAVVSGTIVTVQDAHLFDRQEADIIVSNHISEFDAIALRRVTPAHVLGYDFYKKMLFFRLLGDKFGLVYVPYVSRNQGGAEGRDQVREIIVQKLEKKDKPLVAFPEVLDSRDMFVALGWADWLTSYLVACRAGSRTAVWGCCSTTSSSSRWAKPCSRSRSRRPTAHLYVLLHISCWCLLVMRSSHHVLMDSMSYATFYIYTAREHQRRDQHVPGERALVLFHPLAPLHGQGAASHARGGRRRLARVRAARDAGHGPGASSTSDAVPLSRQDRVHAVQDQADQ